MASRAGIILACLARDAFTVVLLAGLYKLLVTEAWWGAVVAAWRPWSDRALFITLTFVVHETLYFGVNGTFLLFDKYRVLAKYKLPRSALQQVSPELLKKTLMESLSGHGIPQLISLYFLHDGFERFGGPSVSFSAPLPSFTTAMWQVLVSLHTVSAGFYWTHRLVHSKPLYARIHKQHHTYTGTIAFSAEYAHPAEQILSNQLPTVLAPMLLGMHPSLFLVWLSWRLWYTYETHSGYVFPFPFNGFGTRLHDFHHSHNMQTYAGPSSPMWDILGGTYEPAARFLEKYPTLLAQQTQAATSTTQAVHED